MDKIAEGVAMGLSGPSPSFAKLSAFLAKRSFKGITDNIRHYQRGKGLGTVLSTAAKIGYKLGKDKGYKCMGALGATGHYKHFRKPWETIRQPASVIIAEPSGSGKSQLVENLLKEKNSYPPPKKMVYCYDRWPTRFDRMKKQSVIFYKGLTPEGR